MERIRRTAENIYGAHERRPNPNPKSWRCHDIAAVRPHAKGRNVQMLRNMVCRRRQAAGTPAQETDRQPPITTRVTETILAAKPRQPVIRKTEQPKTYHNTPQKKYFPFADGLV